MKQTIILIQLLVFLALLPMNAGANPNGSAWSVFSFNDSAKYTGAPAPGIGTDLATFTFPPLSANKPLLPAFLTTTTVTALLGDLTGKTVSATLAVSVTGAPVFTYGGQGTWNQGTLPANTRLFFSTDANTYSLSQANNNPTCFWWSNPTSVEISSQTGTAQLAVSLTGGNWSDANGQFGSDPNAAAGFTAAVQNVRQIGLSFGGGSFFDVGVALVPNTGAADFHLTSYQVN